MVHKGYRQTEDHRLKKALSKRKGEICHCLVCEAEFWRQPAAIKRGDCKFCSRECYQKWQKGKTKSEEWKRKRQENNLKKAKFLTARMLRKFLMSTNKYKSWRISVFQRDGWSCQKCGIKGVFIEAHHIKPFALFPELRFELSNGLTLCKPCHAKEPKGKEIWRQKLS